MIPVISGLHPHLLSSNSSKALASFPCVDPAPQFSVPASEFVGPSCIQAMAESRRTEVAPRRDEKYSAAKDLWLVVCFVSPLHMFGAFSKLFRKSEPAPALARPTGLPSPPPGVASLPQDGTSARPSLPRPLAGRVAAEDSLVIPYSSIIKLIPQELWGKLAPAGLAGSNYTVSRQSVLEQLPQGSVKVSFGELRRGAPAGVFITSPAEDSRMVDLPLSELLAQLHPDAFARRPDQGRIEVSDEVPDLFGEKGERLAPLRVMEKKEVTNTTTFTRQNVSTPAPPKPAVPAARPPTPIEPPPTNIAPLPTFAPATPALAPLRMPVTPLATPPLKPASTFQFPIPKTAAGGSTQVTRPLPKPTPPKAPGAPVFSQPTGPSARFDATAFLIALDAVAENWPDGVRQELAQLKIPDAKVALPSVDICEGLKRGRIQYPWRTLRSWLQPTPINAAASPHDDLVLELPLRTLTPLFLDFIRANPVNRQAAVTPTLPSMSAAAAAAPFTPAFPVGTPPPATPAAPVSAPLLSFEVAIENGLLCLPLPLIASGWPEPVLRDIAQFSF